MFEIDGMAVQIPLYRRNGSIKGYVFVDASDAAWANQWHWLQDSRSGYVRRRTKVDGRQKVIYLHRELMGMVEGDVREVDHINRDRSDNRRSNLRVVAHAANTQNHPGYGGSSSHRGVSWAKNVKRWRAQVCVGGKVFYLGCYDDEAVAAAVAKAARLRMMPGAVD